MRILLVEDNAVDADLACRALSRLSPAGEADVAPTLAQARRLLASPERYALVLTDLNLPDGSGMELLLEIRARALPLAVVVLTSAGDEQIALAALKAGADDYLPKSDDFTDHLPATVAAALERARADRARHDRRLHVLYAEHNPIDVDLTRRHLERHAPHLTLEAVDSAAQVLARLPADAAAASDIDVLMLDYRLAGETGLDVLRQVREERGLDLPVLMVTGQGGEAVVVQAMRLGATDYLVKHDGYLQVLPQALENAWHRVIATREHAALKASEERLRLVLRGTNDAAWDIDLATGRFHLSPRWWEMLGHDVGASTIDVPQALALVPDEHREDLLQRMWALLKSRDESFELTLSLRHADGHAVPLLVRGFIVRDAQGRALRVAGTNTDLTERKRAEAEIQALNATLERRVAERTRDLEFANRELEAFTSSVSHDLRAPLRSLDALSAVLQAQEAAVLSAEGRRMLDLMRGSIGRMATLVDDLLRFARFAREPLHGGAVPVAALVRQCLSELQGEIEARGIEVQLGDLPDCQADINLLRQVWANLLGNAVKYTRHQPSPRIVIEARHSDDRVVYCVRDNGAGFDMAQADKLFNVFQRLHRPDEFEGTGVGLATAARIVERHGGRIWADAAPRRGATFYFHLGDPAAA